MKSILHVALIFACFGALNCTSLCQSLEAAEPSRRFVEGLQKRGFYDTALDYLTAAPNNPLVTETFKKGIAYEEAATLIHWAMNTVDSRIQLQRLVKGQEKLDIFMRANPQHKWSSLNQGAFKRA